MAPPTITTIREHIAWSYANLARADAALGDGVVEYQRVHHIIRQRLYSGLMSGRMSMRSLYQDERLKMTMPQACYYCGSLDDLAVDHLIPRIKGGADESDNLIWACRCCRPSSPRWLSCGAGCTRQRPEVNPLHAWRQWLGSADCGTVGRADSTPSARGRTLTRL